MYINKESALCKVPYGIHHFCDISLTITIRAGRGREGGRRSIKVHEVRKTQAREIKGFKPQYRHLEK